MPKSLTDLDEREVLALAISLEEEDSRIYRDFMERMKERNPEIASILQSMYEEESSHHERLAELYQLRFGGHIPLIRRQDVKGFIKTKTNLAEPNVATASGDRRSHGDGSRDTALLSGCI